MMGRIWLTAKKVNPTKGKDIVKWRASNGNLQEGRAKRIAPAERLQTPVSFALSIISLQEVTN